MSSNPDRVELGVHSTSVLSRTWTKDITDIDNYRSIAITLVASKVFEKIIRSKFQDCLYTNDNQFSYKVKHSTETCIFTPKSIIDYYISSSSPVYLCYIDASKAFNRVLESLSQAKTDVPI